MTPAVLLWIIAVQVALFQFGSIVFSRNVFSLHFGDLAAPPAEGARRHLTASARLHVVSGVLFAAALASIGAGAWDGLLARRLAIAIVSLASSTAFVLSFLRDRRALRTLKETLPETGVRRAALEVRQSTRRQLFDTITLAAFLSTCLFVLWAVRHLPAPDNASAGLGPQAARMVVYLVVQGIVTALLLWFSFRLSESRTTASPRFPMFREHPDVALRVAMEVADAEVRAFDWAKIGIAAWFACVQLHVFLRATTSTWTEPAHIAQWGCVGFLLVVFGVYLLRVRRIVKRRIPSKNELGNVSGMSPKSSGSSRA